MHAKPTADMTSWIPISESCEFSLQNLPYGVFSVDDSEPRIGTAVGDYVLDLKALAQQDVFSSIDFDKSTLEKPTLNDYASLGKKVHREVRKLLQDLLSRDGNLRSVLQDDTARQATVMIPLEAVTMHLPMAIGDYTDFFVGLNHIENCTNIFHPGAPIPPNCLSLPIAYHGRASSVVVSETPFRRPKGQYIVDGKAVEASSLRLDFEVEFAAFIGQGNEMGKNIPVDEANEHIFGVVLMNDWSARDIQQWESMPLGPFNGKNFCTTISPWIVTLEALEPFRCPKMRSDSVLPYLNERVSDSAYDIPIEVSLGANGVEHPLLTTNTKHVLFSFAQMLAHHTYGGCPMRTGDLIGTGTVSGPTRKEVACLLEATRNGLEPCEIDTGAGRLQRTFLEDGDSIVFRAKGQERGSLGAVGFGRCAGTVLPPS